MEAIEAWLNVRKNKIEHVKELMQVNPLEVSPYSQMSLFPDLIVPDDPELNPIKLLELANKGVGAIIHEIYAEGKKPRERPMEQFNAVELKAAFILKEGGLPKGSNLKRTRLDNKSPAPDKRSKLSPTQVTRSKTPSSRTSPSPDSRVKTPEMNRSKSPIPSPPPARSRSVSPPPSMLPPTSLPPLPQGAPPPLPSGAPPLPPGAPPLPRGPPPNKYVVHNNELLRPISAEEGQDGGGSDSSSDFELEKSETAVDETAPVLKKEMIRAITSLIQIKNWPRLTKQAISQFKQTGYPSGNPFAVPLIRGVTKAVPDTYFDVIEKPLDLATIRNRVNDRYYVTFSQFESDVRLVATNALNWNTNEPILKAIAVHFSACVDKELNQSKVAILSHVHNN